MAAIVKRGSIWRAAAEFELLPVIAGLAVLYVPTIYTLAAKVWPRDEHAHGPIILAVAGWLAWSTWRLRRQAPAAADARAAATMPGFALLASGLLLYALGRSQDIALFEVGSSIPVLAGTVIATRGWATLRAYWFPIFFLAFVVPIPGSMVDVVSGPLKQQVSAITEQILYAAGYPIARSGVILAVGRYQMLVSEACTGISSMYSLLAIGALYLHLARRQSWLHNGLVLASLVPVAFCANIIRVCILVLITFHFGDAAGQGFLHNFSGLLLFLAALLMILLIDSVLSRLIRPIPSA
jgi:exosortase B